MTPEERIDAALAGWRASWEAFDGGAGCVECGVEHGHRPDPGCGDCGGTGVELYAFLRARLHEAARGIDGAAVLRECERWGSVARQVVADAVAAERERCARVCEAVLAGMADDAGHPPCCDRTGGAVAAAIRAGDPAPGSHARPSEPRAVRGRPEEGEVSRDRDG